MIATLLLIAPVVSADTHTERSRAVVTRTTDVVERPDRERVAEDDVDDEEGEGSGVELDVTYNNDGQLDINFEASGTPGDVHISIIINGQTVSSSGGTQEGGDNTSSDGEHGVDGRDGSSSDEDDETSTDDSSDTASEETGSRYDDRNARETFDRSPRR